MAKPDTGPAPHTEVKIMSLSADEFRRSLAFFAPETAAEGAARNYRLDEGEKHLRISLEEMQPFSPGGLIVLPRCRVTLAFTGYGPDERAELLARFDRTFFRGGG